MGTDVFERRKQLRERWAETIATVNHKEFELTIVKTASVGCTELSYPMKVHGEHNLDAWVYQMHRDAVMREAFSVFRIPEELLKIKQNYPFGSFPGRG
jgi:aspartyl/asparaginyl-tRNA synthetase